MKNPLSRCEVSDLSEIGGMKLLLEVDSPSENISQWLSEYLNDIKRLFLQNGAILLRGLTIQGSKKLESVLTSIFDENLMEYSYRSTPRTKMRGRIYTSSEYHPSEIIVQHNENAYSNRWPMKIAFYCVKPADHGGATPIADSRKVYQSIPESIRDEFEQRNLLYVRNYSDIDLPWSEVFQTEDKTLVEEYCKQNNIQYEWKNQNHLKTSQVNFAACSHPITKERVWFNQAHMFHISALSPETRESLLNVMTMDELPRNTYYADGGIIDDEVMDVIRNIYIKHTIAFDWHEGDLLLLDNMRFTHGRQAYSGSRRVLTGMAGPMDNRNPNLELK